ncbi:S-adenosyl-L-methionine-dependent methyltransferase [Myriangium duriaei CBS 260.36]|uniref:S-adenosyl-L-methionine-dependent methyltransferase n=1 Tax=Myriangium duriaei CBS 260.36 TaxID=1168546 RepID=A0A9P4J9U8_9PEZI|nr:S-adenosyl-L-methionine-dependent methyltransferase [Myriangium duriaei CBS 260.36]
MALLSPSALRELLDPFIWILFSLLFLPLTVLSLLSSPSRLLSWHQVQHSWFGRFWTYMGPMVRTGAAPLVEPLLAHAEGVVLDIGPGSGQWVYMYSPKRNRKIKRIYGVEPNREHHPALRKAVREAGLEGVYQIVGVGAEELHLAGVEMGKIDTVVTVMVLCSIPDPKRVIGEVYKYLRPGGRWIVYEHVRTPWLKEFVGWWQRKIDPIWRTCFDGCRLIRPTEEYLKDAGSWSEIDLRPCEGEGIYTVIPHAMGHLTK